MINSTVSHSPEAKTSFDPRTDRIFYLEMDAGRGPSSPRIKGKFAEHIFVWHKDWGCHRMVLNPRGGNGASNMMLTFEELQARVNDIMAGAARNPIKLIPRIGMAGFVREKDPRKAFSRNRMGTGGFRGERVPKPEVLTLEQQIERVQRKLENLLAQSASEEQNRVDLGLKDLDQKKEKDDGENKTEGERTGAESSEGIPVQGKSKDEEIETPDKSAHEIQEGVPPESAGGGVGGDGSEQTEVALGSGRDSIPTEILEQTSENLKELAGFPNSDGEGSGDAGGVLNEPAKHLPDDVVAGASDEERAKAFRDYKLTEDDLRKLTIDQQKKLAYARGMKGLGNAKEDTLIRKNLEWQEENLK